MLLWRYFPSVSSRQGSSNWVGRENHRVQPNILASVGIPASLQCHQIREPTVWQGSLILAQQFSCLLPMVPIPVVWSTADYVHLFFCPLFFFFLVALCGRQDLSSPARSHTYAPAVEPWSLNHWTTREVPICPLFTDIYSSSATRQTLYSMMEIH